MIFQFYNILVSLSHYLIVITLLYGIVIKVPRGTVRSTEKEGKIDAFKECGVGVLETASQIKLSD